MTVTVILSTVGTVVAKKGYRLVPIKFLFKKVLNFIFHIGVIQQYNDIDILDIYLKKKCYCLLSHLCVMPKIKIHPNL